MENNIVINQEQAEAIDNLPKEQVEKVVDPVTTEKEMVAEEKKRQEERDPAEVASMLLTIYTPRFKMMVSKLSNRQLRRLINSLVEYPLKEYEHKDKMEHECFLIGCGLLDAKFSLIQYTYNENAEKIRADAEAARAAADEAMKTMTVEFNAPVEEDEKEVTNG